MKRNEFLQSLIGLFAVPHVAKAIEDKGATTPISQDVLNKKYLNAVGFLDQRDIEYRRITAIHGVKHVSVVIELDNPLRHGDRVCLLNKQRDLSLAIIGNIYQSSTGPYFADLVFLNAPSGVAVDDGIYAPPNHTILIKGGNARYRRIGKIIGLIEGPVEL